MSSFDTAASWIAGGFKDAAEKKLGEKEEDIKARLKKKQADIETRLLNGLGLGEAPKRKDEPKGKDAEVLVWNGMSLPTKKQRPSFSTASGQIRQRRSRFRSRSTRLLLTAA